MFIKVKAYGVVRFINASYTSEVDALKVAPDYDVFLDDKGDVKLFTADEVREILTPSTVQKEDLAATLGVKKTQRKTSTIK